MKTAQAMFTCVKPFFKKAGLPLLVVVVCLLFVAAKKYYGDADFGAAFGYRAMVAEKKLDLMRDQFGLCAALCNTDERFMQGIVFPEVMRYNGLKDDIETESLRTLYVQFGEDYANFSIGLFQMKPTFAEQVETKSKQLLPDSSYNELKLRYTVSDEQNIRQQRVERLQDDDWQLVYLTAFVLLCNDLYRSKSFSSTTEKLQWYATVYNAGFDKSGAYINNKITQDNFYLGQRMPGKKFKYAAIAAWFYNKP